jgi:hypothetical protein
LDKEENDVYNLEVEAINVWDKTNKGKSPERKETKKDKDTKGKGSSPKLLLHEATLI